MKPLTWLLIRLYPASWRVRYGDEFEALLEDSSPGWYACFDLLKGALKMQLSLPTFAKLAAILSVSGLLAGLLVSTLVAPRYMSQAEMRLSAAYAGTGPNALHRNPREFLMQMQNEILSRTSLSAIIQDPRLELYKDDRASVPLEDIIENMRRHDIQIVPTASASSLNDTAFEIAFTYPDAHKARITVRALMARFQDSNLIMQRETQRATRIRNDDRVARLETRIAALEKRLGIPASKPESGNDTITLASDAFNLDVLKPPGLAVRVYPDRVRFMSAGFGAGFVMALIVAVLRRRPPAIPYREAV